MALSLPRYLVAANTQDDSLRYEWDDWRTLPALEVVDEELVGRLKRVSQRAVLAFASGTAEWVVHRFSRLCHDPEPWLYLEAAWAMVIDVRYCGLGAEKTTWQEFALKNWNGPVRRPIHDALKTLEIAFQQLASEYHSDPTIIAATIATLANHVMPDPLPYKTWWSQVIGRFESLYPRSSEDPLGDLVPREAVDPGLDFRPEQTEFLINRFLRSLDYRSNIFLSTPDGMLQHFDGEEDFEGTPYIFSMEADRRRRGRQV